MAAVESVLVIGAGAAGTAAAIFLADAGVNVDLIDVKDTVDALGSGITVQGNALRVLEQLGVYDECSEHGYGFTTIGLRAPDADGTLLVVMDDLRTGGEHLPATLGMYRPELARILVNRAIAAGANVRFGVTAVSLHDHGTHADAEFSDGTIASYDLIIGADGLHSPTRRMLGIDVEPQAIGMGIWRVFTPRPESVTRTDLIYGGPCYIAGYCPTGPDTLYAYLVEDVQDRSNLSPAESLAIAQRLAEDYHGPWDDIRAGLVNADQVHYTKFETHVVPAPWNRGRIVIIGDAAHSCPPTLAQGAAMALEDAAVLSELLLAADTVDDELWTAFMDRRLPRATEVVDASMQLANWLLAHEQGDVPGLFARISHMLMQPA